MSEKIGRRGSATVGVVGGLLSVYMFLYSTSSAGLLAGAAIFGTMSIGGWGMVPGYLAERFPTDARGVGTGFAYHLGVGIAASSPSLVGTLQDGGMDLRQAMLMCIVGGATSILLLLWMGPETRGRELG